MFSWRKKKSAAKPKKVKTPEEIEALLAREGEAFSRSMKDLEQEFAKIEHMPDAGERYLELERFSRRIAPMKDVAVARISEQIAVPKKRLAKRALKWSPVLIVPMFLPVVLSVVEEEARKAREENLVMVRHVFQERGHFISFHEMDNKAPELMRDILQNQTDALALSPMFDLLFDTRKEVKDAFTKAAAKARARENHSFRLNKPAPPKGQAS